MPNSMTGYGEGEGEVGGGRLRVEVRSVNHRHLNPNLKLADDLVRLESDFRDAIRAAFHRGHVTLAARWIERPAGSTSLRVNLPRAQALVEALRELQAGLHLGGEIDLGFVARQPDVIAPSEADPSPIAWDAVAPVVSVAVADAQRARAREGSVLTAELTMRLDQLEASRGRIGVLAPARLERERDRLRQAVAVLADGVQLDDQRVAQEVALLADKLDVTEEVVRLRAHLAAARTALSRDGPVGKELGFLGQEMLREINTIGAKANDAEMAHEVIAMKGAVEKYREQLENLE